MKWFYDPGYDYGGALPGGPRAVHGFVLRKPSEIREALVRDGAARPDEFRSPVAVDPDELLHIHGRGVVEGLRDPGQVARALEFPELAGFPAELVWQLIVAPQLHAAGGTCEALAAAAEGDSAINLSGGYHHAGPDLAHGFCLINDVALALHRLRRRGVLRPVLVVDLDLHQGDGNARFFSGDDSVFTLSLHQAEIFPGRGQRSDLDVELRAGTGDAEYLDQLAGSLVRVTHLFEPEIVVYVAGSDQFEEDALGDLRLTAAGLVERDRRVAEFARARSAPLVAVPAGGYTDASPALAAAGFAEMARILG